MNKAQSVLAHEGYRDAMHREATAREGSAWLTHLDVALAAHNVESPWGTVRVTQVKRLRAWHPNVEYVTECQDGDAPNASLLAQCKEAA